MEADKSKEARNRASGGSREFIFQSENNNRTVDNNICHLYRNEVYDKNSTKARRGEIKGSDWEILVLYLK